MSKTKIEQPQSVSNAFDELLNKMYISNVQNRLRQLNEPTDNDCKRWIWELVQNAKDSIAQDENKQTVDIKVIVRENEVMFKHNGSSFSAKAQLGLLYKYSEGKANNSESTGRFGTGFLTTHTLSKIVSIEGDVFTDDNKNSLCGFSATMYRDGIDEPELLEGVMKMKESILYTKEINNWTTYTYHLKTPQNQNALHLGIDNFILNIAQVMLFCKELSSVELDNNGTVTSIIRKGKQLLKDEIYLSEFAITGETNVNRKFIHKSSKKYSEELTKRFKTNRSIRLTAIIEIDEHNNIVENKDTPSHFCVLPLVGSEKHIMPIYLNSPDFEPDSERESLILIGDEIMVDKDVISEGGINRLILKESVNIFDSLVSYLSDNKYSNLVILAKGLKKLPKVEKNFNKEWFEEEIIIPYRNILTKYDIVETNTKNQKLFADDGKPNILIPKDSIIENQVKIYQLLSYILPDRLPAPKYANIWATLAWKECGMFFIEDLCQFVSDMGNVNELPEFSNQYDWLNKFFLFIIETNENLLKEFPLIPNILGDFVSLENENFAQGIGLTKYMIETLNNMGENLSPLLLNTKITAITLPLKITAKTIAEKIDEQSVKIIKDKNLSIEEIIKQLLPLINIIPTDETKYDPEFIKTQKQIHNFIKTLYTDLNIEGFENNDIPQKAWQAFHNWMVEQLMETVSEFKNIESLPTTIENKIDWINNFISFVSKEIKEGEFDNYAVIPNQKGIFCFKKDLSKDIDIPKEFKTEKAEYFGIKLRDNLLHKGINSINITVETSINSIILTINGIFKENKFEKNVDAIEFAIFIIHLLPLDKDSVIYISQKQIIELVRMYDFKICESNSISYILCNNEDLWRKANDTIINSYLNRIEEDETLGGLRNYLSEESGKNYDDGDAIIFLNDFYDYLKLSNKKILGKIIPNQKGVFCSLDDEFYKDDNIPKDLKDILSLLRPYDDFRNILAEKSLSIQPTNPKRLSDIAKAIDIAIKETYSDSRNWDNANFTKAIQLLMIEWFPKHKGKESKDIFDYTYERKETIEMNVLWSLEERQRMQRARSIPPEVLDKFIEQNGEIESLEEEKKRLEEEIAILKTEVVNTIPKDILTEFPDITADKIRELLKLEERVKGWSGISDYEPENEIQEKRNYENGYKGEAYIFSQLNKSLQFKNVKWAHKSDVATNIEIIDYEGNNHYIKDDFSKYDLTAETHEGRVLYIEVKSTRTTLAEADTIALPISTREWKFVNQIKDDEKYCLARVFNVEKNPEGHYLSLMGIELSKL